jgi:hypothetical protein
MRYVIDNIEVRKVPAEIERQGIAPSQRVRVVVETLDDDLPMAKIAAEGAAFDFLADEPEIYSESDRADQLLR